MEEIKIDIWTTLQEFVDSDEEKLTISRDEAKEILDDYDLLLEK